MEAAAEAVLPFRQVEEAEEEQVVHYPFHLVLGTAVVVEERVHRYLAVEGVAQMAVVRQFFAA